MTFQQARAISKTNKLHIRRTSWDMDKWFMLWRGTWFVFSTGLLQPVRATDYTRDDLLATDWTTVPAPLAACPITSTEPGGGSAPTPGSGAFPYDPTQFPTPPGNAPVSGSSSVSLPTPEPGIKPAGLRVRFNGINQTEDSRRTVKEVLPLDGLYSLEPSGVGVWTTSFPKGYVIVGLDDHHDEIIWTITATISGRGDDDEPFYDVEMDGSGMTPVGSSFTSFQPKPKNVEIMNVLISTSASFYGGHATVL